MRDGSTPTTVLLKASSVHVTPPFTSESPTVEDPTSIEQNGVLDDLHFGEKMFSPDVCK